MGRVAWSRELLQPLAGLKWSQRLRDYFPKARQHPIPRHQTQARVSAVPMNRCALKCRPTHGDRGPSRQDLHKQ